MAVVTGKQAGFTGGHNMIADNITTGRERREGERENKEETTVSTLLEALLKSANSTGGCLLSKRFFCCFVFALCTTTKAWEYKRGSINL